MYMICFWVSFPCSPRGKIVSLDSRQSEAGAMETIYYAVNNEIVQINLLYARTGPSTAGSPDSCGQAFDPGPQTPPTVSTDAGTETQQPTSTTTREAWYKSIARPLLLSNIEFLIKSCSTKLGIKDLRTSNPVQLALSADSVTEVLAGSVLCKCRYDKTTMLQALCFGGRAFLHTGLVFTVRVSPVPRCGVLSAAL